MLTRLYVEALLADEETADAIWELWDAGVITDDLAAIVWPASYDRKQPNAEVTSCAIAS